MSPAERIKDVLSRATESKQTESEMALLLTELHEANSPADKYSIIRVLGRQADRRYEDYIVPFLDSPEDPMLARIALQVLTKDWGLAGKYRSFLHRFARGVPWDGDNDVRAVALSALGEHMRANPDPEGMGVLLSIFEGEGGPQTIRESAYFALARAVGRSWDQLPSAARHFDLSSVDEAILAEARALADRS